MLNFDLQAECIFALAVFIWLTAYGTFFSIYWVCFWLMCFGSSWFETSFFWKQRLVKCPNLWQALHWISFSWAFKSLHVSCISTFWTFILVLMCALGITSLLVLALHLTAFTAMLFVIWLLGLHRWPLLLVFACWQFCALVSEKVDLHGLGITCNLLYVAFSGFGALHPFCKLACSTWRMQIYTFITDCSWYKLLILQEKPENVSVKDLGRFLGYLARLTCACTALYLSSTLQLPCLKLMRWSKWAHTSFDWGLQNSSNFPQIVCKVNSSDSKLQDMYWSMPKSPDHVITFLHIWHSGNAASSHSNIFPHFKRHFENLW